MSKERKKRYEPEMSKEVFDRINKLIAEIEEKHPDLGPQERCVYAQIRAIELGPIPTEPYECRECSETEGLKWAGYHWLCQVHFNEAMNILLEYTINEVPT